MNHTSYPHWIRSASRLGLAALLISVALPTPAQQPSAAQVGAIRQACRADFQTHCAGVPTGGSAALTCLQKNASSVSPACRQALQAASASAPPAATPARSGVAKQSSPAKASATTTTADSWPHTIRADGGSAVVYQPQIISWPDRQTLHTRIALALSPTGAKAAVLGTIEVSFATSTDLGTRWVSLANPQLLSSRFPAADTAQAQRFDQRIRAALAALPLKRVPLDTVLLSLRQDSETPPAVTLHNEPPQIYVSQRPASLLLFDGEPVMAPVAGTPLTLAVNTNWDVFFDRDSGSWYWLNNGAWLRAADIRGAWAPAGALPPAFSALPNDSNFAEARKAIPGHRISAAEVPQVFVSTTPAEIIVSEGAPQFAAIPGTSLEYVTNTDAALFRDTGSGQMYYLVSGRWFSAPSLQGPWSFATPTLPADFARIPADGPRAFVLASVPGTVQAQEALIHAQIPQQATLEISSAKLEVSYAGSPRFEPIAGTAMAYAVNTSFNVVHAENAYYACYQGAWFVAASPVGGWTLASAVPPVIYSIPPSSPLYPCTYVRVYAATPATVTYGYTAGYTMGFVSAGVMVYGTGYYYPPFVYPGPVPIFYPYPVTYAGATYYNSATGAWARGGAIYGPYYGARGGSAYNPATGAYAHGGSVYGPYGGAGAFSAYNPSTGSYAHGSAVWGPDGASGNASWYNARTGVSGSTNQNSNAYGHWGSSTLSGPNQTVHTQSQGNARGSTGSFSSSSGAEGAGVRGAGGNSAGAVKTANGNVYAGADGNVYKKTDDGWQKYNGGSWNNAQKPTSAQQSPAANRTRPTSGGNLSGASTAGTAAPAMANRGQSFAGFGQLEQDHAARFGGAERQQRFSAAREGGFAGRFGGGGGFGGRFRR
ncbi:hypothetical protein [Accumulibacter sp.]|uniref:hypothetical protein n=1 Tax=Accumulibacter sp. TaxID=2053492 RepID=UPI0028C38BC4|nr:hypothetical protein [Accumulibacter sp.]